MVVVVEVEDEEEMMLVVEVVGVAFEEQPGGVRRVLRALMEEEARSRGWGYYTMGMEKVRF